MGLGRVYSVEQPARLTAAANVREKALCVVVLRYHLQLGHKGLLLRNAVIQLLSLCFCVPRFSSRSLSLLYTST